MKRIAIILLFPFFVPLMAISLVAFAWMVVTPVDPRHGTGPSNSDVLGIYFMMLCAFVGGILQLVIGIPFCVFLTRSRSRVLRPLLGISMLIIGVAPFASMTGPPHTIQEQAISMLIVCVSFGIGIWVPIRLLHPFNSQAEQSG